MIARAAAMMTRGLKCGFLEKVWQHTGFFVASPVQCVTDHPRLEMQVFLWDGLEGDGHPKQKCLEVYVSRRLFAFLWSG